MSWRHRVEFSRYPEEMWLCNIGYPSETRLKPKYREISFVYNLLHSQPIVLKFCREHDIAVNGANFNDWAHETDVMGERDFARF